MAGLVADRIEVGVKDLQGGRFAGHCLADEHDPVPEFYHLAQLLNLLVLNCDWNQL